MLQLATSEWQRMPPEQLAAKPAPDKWSTAQCLEHLNIYGRHYLPAMEKAIRAAERCGSEPAKTFRAGWLGAYFTKLMLPQPGGSLKLKMKSPKDAVPSESPDAAAMLAEFIDQQERMLLLLTAAQAVNLTTVRVPTSLSPWIRLRLGDTLGFVVAHLERHVLQASRACELCQKGGYNFSLSHPHQG